MPGLCIREEEREERRKPPQYWCQLPENRKALARNYIRRLVKQKSWLTEDGMANVALEGLWNVMHFDDDDN